MSSTSKLNVISEEMDFEKFRRNFRKKYILLTYSSLFKVK